jgi:hypothetical protein
MTAPRSCSTCGNQLSGDVRWCLRCYTAARELTPRAPVWAPGEFVDNPTHTGGHAPRWSRWEKSATTLGPRGRIGLTVALFATVPFAASVGMFLYLLWFPVIAVVVLRGVWAKGWMVPDDGPRDVDRPAPAPMSTWLWDRSEFLHTLALAAFLSVDIGALLWSQNNAVRFAAVCAGLAACVLWIYGKVNGPR